MCIKGSPYSFLLYISVWRGTHLQVLIVAGVWSQDVKELNMYGLWMRAVQVTLKAFLPRIIGESVVLISDNATVVAYLEKLGTLFSE